MKSVHTNVIRQLAQVLDQLSSQQYAQSLCVLNGSSIGQHTRHVIEFYQCLMKGYQTGLIDYDARERNFLLENDLFYSLKTIEDLMMGIENIPNLSETLRLTIAYQPDAISYVETNFMREMAYLIEHSIHHYALIRIGLQENFKEIIIPENFGIAYSTIQHKNNCELVNGELAN